MKVQTFDCIKKIPSKAGGDSGEAINRGIAIIRGNMDKWLVNIRKSVRKLVFSYPHKLLKVVFFSRHELIYLVSLLSGHNCLYALRRFIDCSSEVV